MASTGAKLKSEATLRSKASLSKLSQSASDPLHPSEIVSKKKIQEPVKLDEDGKVIINPSLGTHILTNSWTIWFMNRGPGVKISNYLDATKELDSFSTIEEFWKIYTHLKRVDRLPFTSEFQIFRKGVKPMWEDPVNVNGGKWVFRFKRPFKTFTNNSNLYSNSNTNSANNSLTSTPTTSHALLATTFNSSTDGTTTPTGLSSAQSLLSSSQGATYKVTGNQARIHARLLWEKLLLSMIGGVLADDSKVDSNEITGIVMSVRKDEDIFSVWTRSGEHGEGNPNIRDAIRKLLELPETQTIEFKNHSESIKEGAQKQALYNSNMLNHTNNNNALSGGNNNSNNNNHSHYNNNNGGYSGYHNHNHHHHHHYNNNNTNSNNNNNNNHHHHHHHHQHHNHYNNHNNTTNSNSSNVTSPSSQNNGYWNSQNSSTVGITSSPSLSPSPGLFQHSNNSNSSLNNHHHNNTNTNNTGGHSHHHNHHHTRHNFDSNGILRSSSPSPSPFAGRFGTGSSSPLNSRTSAQTPGGVISGGSVTTSPVVSHKTLGLSGIW